MTTEDAVDRLVHEMLVQEAAWGLASLYDTWSRHWHIDPFVLIWPEEAVVFHGDKTASTLPFDLPEERDAWPDELRKIAKETKAYAILLVQEMEQALVVIFESRMGTRSWRIPIEDHGNVRVLGDPEERTDTDRIGLLWG